MGTAQYEFEYPVETWFDGDYAQIPERMQEALRLYVLHGVTPGDFLTGIITNNLRLAVGHADSTNAPLIRLYLQWFWNVAPARCHGSDRNMRQWVEERQALRT